MVKPDIRDGSISGNITFQNQIVGVYFLELAFHDLCVSGVGGVISVHAVLLRFVGIKGAEYLFIYQHDFGTFPCKGQRRSSADALWVVGSGDDRHLILQAVIHHAKFLPAKSVWLLSRPVPAPRGNGRCP